MSFNPSGGGKLSSASDIALNNPIDGQVLKYSASLQKWQNQATAATLSPNSPTSRPSYPAPSSNPYSIVFQDLFQLPNGSSSAAPDTTKWSHEQGTGSAYGNTGWGNNELEAYTTQLSNAEVTANGLELRLINQPFNAYDGTTSWTSAKLVTKSKFAFTYGKAEAVIKVPSGKGAWPAFWMLGDSNPQVNWPACGEIDIMETGAGGDFTKVLGTVHGPGYSGGHCVSHNLTSSSPLSNAFHKYAIEWTPGRIDWLLDDSIYSTVLASDVPQPHNWVFDQPHYLILNVAVANGGFSGTLDTSTFTSGSFNGQTAAYATMTVQSVTVSQRL